MLSKRLNGRLAGEILPAIALSLLVAPVAGAAGPLKDAVTLYLDGNSLKSPYNDVRISGSIRLVEDGKFGKALLIERRTVNLVPNGDFKSENMDGWSLDGPAARLASGGVEGAPCLNVKTGANVALPFTNQQEKNAPYAFSFYAKAVGSGKIAVASKVGDRVTQLDEFEAPADEYKRFTVSFKPETDAFTLRLSVTGEVLLSNVQLESGATWASTFSTPLKMRDMNVIEIPANGRYLDAKQGAVSCWVNVPWMDSRQSGNGMAVFGLVWKNPEYTGWGAYNALIANVWNKTAYLTAIDRQKRACVIGIPTDQVKPAAWHHLVYSWNWENDQITLDLYLDGGALHSTKTMPFGPLKPVDIITIGYREGGYLDGKLDDLAAFNRLLTKEEVMLIYSSGKPLSETLL